MNTTKETEAKSDYITEVIDSRNRLNKEIIKFKQLTENYEVLFNESWSGPVPSYYSDTDTDTDTQREAKERYTNEAAAELDFNHILF